MPKNELVTSQVRMAKMKSSLNSLVNPDSFSATRNFFREQEAKKTQSKSKATASSITYCHSESLPQIEKPISSHPPQN
jgi:hypothetical protein